MANQLYYARKNTYEIIEILTLCIFPPGFQKKVLDLFDLSWLKKKKDYSLLLSSYLIKARVRLYVKT